VLDYILYIYVLLFTEHNGDVLPEKKCRAGYNPPQSSYTRNVPWIDRVVRLRKISFLVLIRV